MYKNSIVRVLDNTGARHIKILDVLPRRKNPNPQIKTGRIFYGVVLIARFSLKVKKKMKTLGLCILSKQKELNKDGSFFKYNKNVVILLKNMKSLSGNRIKSRISLKFRFKKLKKH